MKFLGSVTMFFLFSLWLISCGAESINQTTIFGVGNENNDLFNVLRQNRYKIKHFSSPTQALEAASEDGAVFLLPSTIGSLDSTIFITSEDLDLIQTKNLGVYIEGPVSYPRFEFMDSTLRLELERGVVTTTAFGSSLDSLALMELHDMEIRPAKNDSALIKVAKVLGVNKAELGLEKTLSYPLLFQEGSLFISFGTLSNFISGRYGPQKNVEILWSYILRKVLKNESLEIDSWEEDVRPSYTKAEDLPENALINSIKQGIDWYYNAHFFVDSTWLDLQVQYADDGTNPVGPSLDSTLKNGDGSLGIIQGQQSIIKNDGRQLYNYWIRADVQAEVAMTLAASGRLFDRKTDREIAKNLLDYIFHTSNLRSGEKDNPESAAYGLIGWATTHPGSFYGDDNARAILGVIGAATYSESDEWNKYITEAVIGNFRTTGKEGFRGDRLEEGDIIKNGLDYYQNRDLVHLIPHFESWLWACYLWLYDKTGYEPLLSLSEKAIRSIMEAYPEDWLWGSSMQMQRARMILPLAWLVRVTGMEDHKAWLDKMIREVAKYQDESGAIREEIGQGPGWFKPLNSNEDYGTDEGSLIYENGDPISDLLYTCNFALFGLNEAIYANDDPLYKEVRNKLSDFMTRIQVSSEVHSDINGAWFRAFNYDLWDYWASNSDWGWGAWCTLGGWSQSWILTSQILIEEDESFWDLSKDLKITDIGNAVIKQMLVNQK